MNTRRLAAATAAAALFTVPLAATAIAADGPAGTGTSKVSASVLELSVAGGDLLSVRLLGADTFSTTDGARSASSSIVPLAVSTSAVPGLGDDLPTVSTSSTGAEHKEGRELDLSAVPGFAGKLTAALSSVVDDAGARSGTDAGISKVSLAGGLVRLPQGGVDISTDAAKGKSAATHTVSIPQATVLDLTAVLEALGLSLPDLSLDALLRLVDQLGLPLDIDVDAVVGQLDDAINVLEGHTGPLTDALCAEVDGILGGALGTIGGVVGGIGNKVDDTTDVVDGTTGGVTSPVTKPVDGVVGGIGGVLGAAGLLGDGVSCDSLVGLDVVDVLKDVQDTLAGLIDGLLAVLDGTALLSIEDVTVGLQSTATDSIETSTAAVTASIGSVKVGALSVPGVSGLDLAAPLQVVNDAVTAIEAEVNGVLGSLNAKLANLVDIDVLDIDELVSSTPDGVVEALSSVTALRATITPPTGLLGAAAIDLEGTVAGVLGTLGAAIPALDPLMAQLEATLGGLDLLTAPTVVSVGTISATSTFRAAQVTPGDSSTAISTGGTPTGELPRTGSDAALPAMMAVALAGAAVAIRRLLRHATV